MAAFSEIAQFCPYPIVNLHTIGAPHDGFQLPTLDSCRRFFGKDHRCREHYERLFDSPDLIGRPVQCPHGFVSLVVATNTQHFAVTGVIPYPRCGGPAERSAAKSYPTHKVTLDSILSIARALQLLEQRLAAIEQDAVSAHAMALHEIRKLNRTVKQTAERLCRRDNSESPELASKELVQIWKSAEIMSQQFDIIEMLANESLTDLPLNSTIEVYRIFDKCARIYNSVDGNADVNLWASHGFSGRIYACDKTFPIIPTVLIENALKYGKHAHNVDVQIYPAHNECVVEVRNCSEPNPLLNNSIFQKGKRATQGKEGSGHGLYLAQLVAKQHGSTITLDIRPKSSDECTVTFKVTFPIAD
jgi:light-regulated signal transduction histidine kinase (bacteriophytochrome)